MFKKILIANRGEIAVRVIRACRELGVDTVAVYSEADASCLHTRLADEAVCVGPPATRESYMSIANLISAALITGAEAIHPGYGFLSENASFAEACEACGLVWIGPPPEAIRQMGDKAQARALMREHDVPTVPGTRGIIQNDMDALRAGGETGYPLIVKAAAGGGGKGMRIVHSEEELLNAVQLAQKEAATAFGNPEVYLEKYIEEPRHVEFQILADGHGEIIHLGERECSIQTVRHQKMLEEGPCAALTGELRQRMGEAAIAAARAVDYRSAGTIEFLLDKEGQFYFMEMNTRIQVEHPVTEWITGVDLVKKQIQIAAGKKLGMKQADVRIDGHCIECRITAEDPERGFAPSAGKITELWLPGGPGIRVDTHVYAGYTVPPYYDSLLCKLTAWAPTRLEAIQRMDRALAETHVEGIQTTISFHQRIMRNAWFRRGEVFTNFIRRRMSIE